MTAFRAHLDNRENFLLSVKILNLIAYVLPYKVIFTFFHTGNINRFQELVHGHIYWGEGYPSTHYNVVKD